MNPRVVLGIETSCDETASAILIDGKPVSDRITTQILHEQYGGVVPELASRAHEQLLMPAVQGSLQDAGLRIEQIDAIAVTAGPGLAGALLVGVAFAKGLSIATGIPYWGVNHLEGHIWSPGLTTPDMPTPFLALIVSGGHTLLVEVESFGRYRRVGTTRDDAAGELFDKVGRVIGYPFPSGAAIDKAALDNRADPIALPIPKIVGEPTSLSFSGLKTAALFYLRDHYDRDERGVYQLSEEDRSRFCAGLMDSVGKSLGVAIDSALKARQYKAFVVAGGVSASRYLRKVFEKIAADSGVPLLIPPFKHCTDNGSMIAYAGWLRAINGSPPSSLDDSINPAASLFSPEVH